MRIILPNFGLQLLLILSRLPARRKVITFKLYLLDLASGLSSNFLKVSLKSTRWSFRSRFASVRVRVRELPDGGIYGVLKRCNIPSYLSITYALKNGRYAQALAIYRTNVQERT